MLDNAPVGFGFFDHELRFLRLEPRPGRNQRRSHRRTYSSARSDVLPELSPEVSESCRRVLETGQSIVNKEVTGTTRPARFRGRRYWLCNFYPVKLPGGAVLGAGAVVTDSTTANAWRRHSKMPTGKDQFLAMLAHELRNPLAPISNAVQIMQLEGPNGPTFAGPPR